MKLEIRSISDRGLKRQQNQDAVLVYQNNEHDFAFCLVADGMGGHSNGGKASGEIVAELRAWLPGLLLGDYSEAGAMLQAIQKKMLEINSFIWQAWNQEQICGSTCVILFLLGETFGIFSVGDSRIYRCRRFGYDLLTKDDVWENQSSVRQLYNLDELKNHPNYGKLVHAVGCDEELIYSSQTGMLRRGDVFALCSDGIYKFCDERFLQQKLSACRKQPLESAQKAIVGEVYRRGALDNLSLILVRYG